VENINPTKIRSPDHSACSELLYRLRYPGPQHAEVITHMLTFILRVMLVRVLRLARQSPVQIFHCRAVGSITFPHAVL